MNSIGCWICHREFPSVEEYIRHMCCRPTVENNSTLYSCQKCSNGFPSALSFGNHMCRRKKTDNQENSTSHSTQKRKTPDNEENNLPQMKKKRVGGKSCNEDSMGKLDNEEDKTTKKKEGNMKNGNQVGRGRRVSLGSRAQIETTVYLEAKSNTNPHFAWRLKRICGNCQLFRSGKCCVLQITTVLLKCGG